GSHQHRCLWNPACAVLLLHWLHQRISKPGSLHGGGTCNGTPGFHGNWTYKLRRLDRDRSNGAGSAHDCSQCPLPKILGQPFAAEPTGSHYVVAGLGLLVGSDGPFACHSNYRRHEDRFRSRRRSEALWNLDWGVTFPRSGRFALSVYDFPAMSDCTSSVFSSVLPNRQRRTCLRTAVSVCLLVAAVWAQPAPKSS